MARRLIGLAGGVIVLVGVFLPAWAYEYTEQLSTTVDFLDTHFLGPAVLVLAIAALAAALFGKSAWFWITGPGSLLVLLVALAIFASHITQTSAGGLFWPWDPGVRPTRVLSGPIVLLAGTALQILAAALPSKKPTAL